MKKSRFRTSIVVVPAMIVSCFLSVGLPARAQSEAVAGSCSNATISGTYGFSAQGVLIAAPGLPAEAQFRSVGLVRFDGQGNFKWLENTVLNGIRLGADWVAAGGTYSVNPNCTGTLTANTPNSPVPITLAFVVVKQGSEFYGVEMADAITSVFTRVH